MPSRRAASIDNPANPEIAALKRLAASGIQRDVHDVTAREIRERTVAVWGGAAEGNFAPKVAFSGTSATDPYTSRVG